MNLLNYLLNLFRRGQYVFYTALFEKLVYFIIFIFFARTYSVAEYGGLISLFVFGNILVSLTELGFANYFQRSTASDLKKSIQEFNSAFTFRLVTYLIILLVSLGYFYKNESTNVALIVIIVTSIFIFNTSWMVIKFFYGLNEYRSVFNRFIISRMILIVSPILPLFTNISITIISLGFLISAISEIVMLILLLRQKGYYSFTLNMNVEILKRIFRSSAPMGLGVFFVVVYDRIDVLLIQKIIGIESVSFYAVAYSLYKIPHIISGVLLTPLYTDLSAEYQLNKKIDYDRIKKLGFFLVIFCILSIAIYFFLSDFLIEMIYGKKYLFSADILKLLVIALPFLFLNNLTGVTLNSIRKEKLAFYSAAVATLFNLLLNIFLLNFIGIAGAVISTILTELLIFLIQLNFVMKFKADFSQDS